MTKPTKANAKAWLAQQDGKTFITSQVRHNGELWEPGPRVLTVSDRNPMLPRFFFAPEGAPSYSFSETVIDGREYKVLELDESHMTLAWLNDRGDFISVTEYRLEGQL